MSVPSMKGKRVNRPSLVSPFHADLQFALTDSLLSGSFIDVRLCACSRRLPSGRVDRPGVLYANSEVLKAASPYLRGLLAGGFAESVGALDGEIHETNPIAYDYESDSDLEDDGGEDEGEASNTQAQSWPKKIVESTGSTTGATTTPTIQAMGTAGGDIRTVMIKDSAYTTWQNLLFYLYTGQVHYAPLKSQGVELRRSETRKYRVIHPRRPPPYSPKSMYRLANILGLDGLKLSAAYAIKEKLSAKNVLDELCSTFSSRYSDIKDEQVRYFESHCRNSEMVPQLRSKLELLSSGTLSHSVPALVDLFCLCLIEVKTPSSATIAPVAEHV